MTHGVNMWTYNTVTKKETEYNLPGSRMAKVIKDMLEKGFRVMRYNGPEQHKEERALLTNGKLDVILTTVNKG